MAEDPGKACFLWNSLGHGYAADYENCGLEVGSMEEEMTLLILWRIDMLTL
jgi:hypothetical protein